MKLAHPRTLLFGALLLLPACSAPKQPHRLSDFLGDTSELRVQHENDGVLFFEKEDARWLEYQRVWIDPPVLVPVAGEDPSVLESAQARELAVWFHERLIASVAGAYPVVDGPGPDVLHVRTAITGIVPVRGRAGEQPGAGVAMNFGGAAMEAMVLDSMTNTRLAAFADNQQRRRFGSLNVLSTWNDAEEAFEDWAQRFRVWLDRTHGRAQPDTEREARR